MNKLTYLIGLECIEMDYSDFSPELHCYNYQLCKVYSLPWSLPYIYKIVDSVPTLVVNGSPVISISWDYDVAEELDLIIKSAWQEAGWHPAEPVCIVGDWDEIPF